MKRLIVVSLVLWMAGGSVWAGAEERGDTIYRGGTVAGLQEGAEGRVDTTAADALKFRSGIVEVSIPYGQMTRIEYREQNRFRLGVVATIVVGMLKAREKVHQVTITWTNDRDPANVVTLEMTRQEAVALLHVLNARAPAGCTSGLNSTCSLPR